MKAVTDRKKVSVIHKDFLRMNVRGMLLNTDNEAYYEDESIWIKDNYFNFLYTEDLDFLLEFDKRVGNEFGFSGANDFVLDYYKDHELIHWKNSCNQYHYPGDKFESVMDLDSLSLEDADYVNEHYEYNNDDSLKKIKHAIKSRPTSCLRLDGKNVSFVLLHDDDSIGYMFTLPEYRGKGYAYELTKDIINKTIDLGRLPYVQIVCSNKKSIGLALKTGFVFHGIVHQQPPGYS
ncbi:GNAT family N-acetyltransferase [Acidaminobacter sp. JC074]|uniref:GNAT family N-acetyltransferase n=1 Tax=Acidaminobacter sp. JC074 TaxID=2530199 RepID=UPI001F0D5077|nr:GNAT family N-acetyltransferase [Acidaminobacter sp. JC074]MCH4890344.1 GNAT family N-acetyltransferase [Acidaminobacter sp. JC074]